MLNPNHPLTSQPVQREAVPLIHDVHDEYEVIKNAHPEWAQWRVIDEAETRARERQRIVGETALGQEFVADDSAISSQAVEA